MYSIYDSDYELVNTLLKDNTDLNIQNKNGYTALMIATMNGNEKLVRQLLLAKANTEITDRKGKTAINHAEERGFTTIVKMINSAGRKNVIIY